MKDDPKTAWRTFTEEVEVAGSQLVGEVSRLIAEGNVRRIELRSESGDVFLSVPLTAGALAGGAVVLAAPWLAMIAAVAGLVAKVRLTVVRTAPPHEETGDESPSDPPDRPAA